jgi:hypothetical protein
MVGSFAVVPAGISVDAGKSSGRLGEDDSQEQVICSLPAGAEARG